jgi:hypothetical protein
LKFMHSAENKIHNIYKRIKQTNSQNNWLISLCDNHNSLLVVQFGQVRNRFSNLMDIIAL